MSFSECRARFADYVAHTLSVSVHFEDQGQTLPDTMSVGEEFDVRVVCANHPGGVPEPTPSDDPLDGTNLQDVRFHLEVSDPATVLLLVDEGLENTTFRSGWDVDAAVLTAGDWVAEMYIHFAPEHPTFDLPTSDVLDDVMIRGRTVAPGTFQVSATARATPRWRDVSTPAASVNVSVG